MNDAAVIGNALALASQMRGLAHHQVVPVAIEFAELLAPGWTQRRADAEARGDWTRRERRMVPSEFLLRAFQGDHAFDPADPSRTVFMEPGSTANRALGATAADATDDGPGHPHASGAVLDTEPTTDMKPGAFVPARGQITSSTTDAYDACRNGMTPDEWAALSDEARTWRRVNPRVDAPIAEPVQAADPDWTPASSSYAAEQKHAAEPEADASE